MAIKEAEFEPTATSSLTRMSMRRSLGVGAIILVAAMLTTLLAISIASAFG